MKNKYISSVLNAILLFAVIHFVIIILTFIMTLNFEYINIFRILGLNEFIPGIEKGEVSFLLSSVVVIVVVLFFLRKKG